MQHLTSLFDLARHEIERIFAISSDLKAKLAAGVREPLLAGHVLALLFEKPSLRTRVSFEAGMTQLGGGSLFLGQDVGWGKRESIQDFARVLGQYVDLVACRATAQQKVEELAAHCDCRVINGLTDQFHPCQALADLFTLQEVHGSLQGLKLAFVGDANNVARSLAVACGKLGVSFTLAAPPAYQFPGPFVDRLKRECPDLKLQLSDDPRAAVADARGVYTDVWTSMGQESERAERLRAFAGYQVNESLMKLAAPEACFMHCLPVRRGEEVTDEVIDGPQSVVLQQASNRMHVQKGLMVWLLKEAASKPA